jgi:hypothetical protein
MIDTNPPNPYIGPNVFSWGPNASEDAWQTCYNLNSDFLMPAFIDRIPQEWMSDWFIIQQSIRRFYLHGLLLPIDVPALTPANNGTITTIETLRKLPKFIHQKLCSLPTHQILHLLPDIDGEYFFINENPTEPYAIQVIRVPRHQSFGLTENDPSQLIVKHK